jgi:leucyl aminopeptidase
MVELLSADPRVDRDPDRHPGADTASTTPALPLWLVTEGQVVAWRDAQPAPVAAWVRQHQFAAERHRVLVLPGADGQVAAAVLGLGALPSVEALTPWHAAGLPDRLPAGTWQLAEPLASAAATRFALGWLHGSYRHARYRSQASGTPATAPQLVAPPGIDLATVRSAARASAMARDLINAPANDLGPAELADAAATLAARHGAAVRCFVGPQLEAENFPLIHAVGRASRRAPRLIDLRWGRPGAPRVTLVGKGVCFDTGGLDLKPSAGMLLMKKDMGGAAVALAVASMLMEARADIALRVLIPAVENSIDGDAYRPGDVLRSRKGLSVEITNTDAEGRLVLADALAEADAEHPALLLDFATLTGAARTALGPELPALYANDAALLAQAQACGVAESDPAWPLPLWDPYEEDLSSRVADLVNASSTPFAGSITAALFLRRFVAAGTPWAHFDLYAWNPRERPGRPVGAEAQCVRLAYRLVRERCG